MWLLSFPVTGPPLSWCLLYLGLIIPHRDMVIPVLLSLHSPKKRLSSEPQNVQVRPGRVLPHFMNEETEVQRG